MPPLNQDQDLIDTLEKEESFSKAFIVGVQVREKRESQSLSDSSAIDQV